MSHHSIIGPVLFLDDLSSDRLHLAAVFLADPGAEIPPVYVDGADHPAGPLAVFGGVGVYRVRFSLPATEAASYSWAGQTFPVASDFGGDLRLAYVSCNGQEHGDLTRAPDDRNVMWQRLCDDHERAPFSVLMQGGDQIYADEITDGHPLSDDWPKQIPDAPDPAELQDLKAHLAMGLAERYRTLYGFAPFAWLAARVPSLCMWDDHDICDGWGSLHDDATASAVGQCLFATAREAALLFQHGCVDGDLPARFQETSGSHMGWSVKAPDLHLIAPDLRSERTRHLVMGPKGWAAFREAAHPVTGHTFLMSSTPLLGPRLSIVESLMPVLPARAREYEDDLRDQWQSHAHRDEWADMLRAVSHLAAREDTHVTVLSGEIHLATRATMSPPHGSTIHQLVASGITHPPPPRAFARALGALAGFGAAPLADHPIRIHPLPGQTRRYTAERNTLVLNRTDGKWQARWNLEDSGPTPPLDL